MLLTLLFCDFALLKHCELKKLQAIYTASKASSFTYSAITLYLKILSFLQFYVGVHLREQFFAQVKSIFSTLEQKIPFPLKFKPSCLH
jgi:hypothetical protein